MEVEVWNPWNGHSTHDNQPYITQWDHTNDDSEHNNERNSLGSDKLNKGRCNVMWILNT